MYDSTKNVLLGAVGSLLATLIVGMVLTIGLIPTLISGVICFSAVWYLADKNSRTIIKSVWPFVVATLDPIAQRLGFFGAIDGPAGLVADAKKKICRVPA